jgi:polyhydroxyalkanoate synthesis regulator phasin
MANKDVDQFASPVKKLMRFFKKSRDGWKAKHREWKEKAKLLSNQTRAVEKSRQQWRERASAAERRVAELERQVEKLKFCRSATIHG